MKCVYKISCLNKEVKEFYIGSTNDLEKRIDNHKSYYRKQPDNHGILYNFIREHGGLSNWEINAIEIYECEMTKLELKQEEQFYLDEYKPQLNTIKALGIDKEKRKQIIKYFNHKKAKCPYCNEEMLKRNINRHIKRKHTTSTQ